MQEIIPTILLKQIEQLSEEICLTDSEKETRDIVNKIIDINVNAVLTLQLLMNFPFLVIL